MINTNYSLCYIVSPEISVRLLFFFCIVVMSIFFATMYDSYDKYSTTDGCL